MENTRRTILALTGTILVMALFATRASAAEVAIAATAPATPSVAITTQTAETTKPQSLADTFTSLSTSYARSQAAVTILTTNGADTATATIELVKTATALSDAKILLAQKAAPSVKISAALTSARVHLLQALTEAKLAIAAKNSAANTTAEAASDDN